VNLIQSTSVPHLSYIAGGNYFGETSVTAENVISDLRQLPFDYIIIDTSVSQSTMQLELIRRGNEVLLVTAPEPSAIEKSYRWIEQYVACELASDSTLEARLKIDRALEDFRNQPRGQLFNFRRYVKSEHGITPDHFEKLLRKPVRLVVNGIRTPNDNNLGFSMKSVCQKFYDFLIDPVSNIEFDNAAWQSQRNKEVFLMTKPFSPIAGELMNLAKKLTARNFSETNMKAVV
jgi:flagellar biosynthesis protein FlhG